MEAEYEQKLKEKKEQARKEREEAIAKAERAA